MTLILGLAFMYAYYQVTLTLLVLTLGLYLWLRHARKDKHALKHAAQFAGIGFLIWLVFVEIFFVSQIRM